ncbi:alpha-L-fucosidase [Dactylosporangium sp. NPDC005555]|uniref:alpha-L-fucosidase n=1 Tax=Dactylosporangium sp. NPDC005555 TaxID=3154889 RepID=UPI0033A09927
MRLRALIPLLVMAAGVLVPVAPAAAAPGDNLVADDALSAPRTRWFDEARFGMFVHFGPYAVYKGQYGSCRGAEWIKRECDIPWSDYEAKAAAFNPAAFDANAIVQLAKQAGQKYIVITSKHHDGYAMWPTATNAWNLRNHSSLDPGRDLLRELKTAATAQGIKLGLYYSIWDWHNPDFTANFPRYVTTMKAQLQELVTAYDPALLWFDGEWTETNPTNPWSPQDGEDLERYVRGISPQVVINNRVGKRRAVDGDYGTPEQELASAAPSAQLQESCMTINNTWGYAAWDTTFKSPATLVRNLTTLTSTSANLLLNIGPTDTGAVTAGQADALRGVGTWMATNSKAVHGAGYTGLVEQPAWGRVSRSGGKLYLTVNAWAGTLHLRQRSPFTITGARVLGSASPVTVRAAGDGFDLLPSGSPTNSIATVIEADIAAPAPTAAGTGTGLKAEFWNNTTFSGAPLVTRTDPTVNYAWRSGGSPAASIGTDNFAGRWTGSIEPRYSERYTFTAVSDDTVRLWVGGELLVDNTTPHGPAVDQGGITLVAGRRYDIRLEHTERGGEAYMKLIWSSPNTPAQVVPRTQLSPAAGTTVRRNDTVATYTAGWSTSTGRGLGDFNDDVSYTTTDGASFSYTFTGTGIDYLAERNSDQGLVDVYLDGALQATVDTSSGPRLTQQVIWSARGLPPGTHTLRGVKRSGTYMLVDRFDVTA